MVLPQMVVDSVVLEGHSIRVTAQRYGVSKSWVAELVKRYRAGGPETLVPQSKRPQSNPRSMSLVMQERIIAMRKELEDYGSEAGAETIHWHHSEGGFAPPSVASIYRLLKRRGLITPEPRKRPRASYIRFEASLPNECWQTNMTHWHFSDGTQIEFPTFIDDYSRRVLACDVFWAVKGNDVRRVFARTCEVYDILASVLSDNGAIYNARRRNGRQAAPMRPAKASKWSSFAAISTGLSPRWRDSMIRRTSSASAGTAKRQSSPFLLSPFR